MIIGIIIIVIGLTFFLQSLGLITGDVWQTIWPCLLIILGIGLIYKERAKCCCEEDCKKEKK